MKRITEVIDSDWVAGYYARMEKKEKEGEAAQGAVSESGGVACMTCNGLGWVKEGIKDHTAPMFGQMTPCQDCGIIQSKRSEKLEEISGLTPSERRISMQDFISRCEDTPAMIEVVEEFAGSPWGFLTLWGGPGNGKTLALMALANRFRQQGRVSVYITFVDLLDYIRAGFDKSADENSRQRYETIRGAYFLAVDEIDKANMTSYAEEFRTRFLDDRYRLGLDRQVHTAFAMNLAPEMIMPSHIYSRLRDGRFVVFENKDPDMRPSVPSDWVQDKFE